MTDFDDYPPEVADIAKVVTMAQVDVEAVVAAEPDLVIAAGNELTPTTVIEQLTELGLPVLTLYPESLDEIYADIELVGQALDRDDEAARPGRRHGGARRGGQVAVAGLERPRTFYEVSVFEGVDLHRRRGVVPGQPDRDGRRRADHRRRPLDVDRARGPRRRRSGAHPARRRELRPDDHRRVGGGPAGLGVDDRRRPTVGVVPVTEDIVITRPGPRIVDGLEALARAIHPDAFGG